MAGVVMDITERKNAEAALRESESHFRLLADTVPQMVWITYPDGRHAYFNQRWYEFTGVPEGSTGGEGWAGLFHPEDEQRVRAHWRRNLESGEPYEIEYRLRQRGGRYCWFLCRALPVRDAAGQIVRWFGTCTDIDSFKRLQNRLRKSEERFRRVFEHAATGIAIADGHGRFEQCNPAYCALLGYTEEELRQKNLDALVHPEDLAENTELNRRLRLGEIPFVELENRYVRKDGQIVWVRKFVSPLDGTSVGRTRLIALVTDITERRENENALKEAKEAAEAANRGKDRFLAMLSHELRTPLTPVLMTAAELRSDESLPAEVREHLEMIERNVALEARLIDDLLDLTRITRGKLTLRAEPCDLHSLLSLVAEMVQSEARQKQIQVELDLAARQTFAIGDSARLQQVFWNLLRNAVKFTPVGGHVRIHSSDAGDRARIEVSDDGIGFEPAAAARIFEPFEQTGSGHRFGGLGLGLSIAKAVVDLHQGTIIAESAGPGKGARFVVELPRAGAAQEESAAPGAHHANGNTRNAEAPMRLLLVEDHEPTREVLTRLLTRAGHQVTTARCLEEARAAALAQSFDAVVSDLGLPDGTGIELMAHLRSAHNLRGIALSGYGMDEDLQRSRDAGFVTHLVKPVDVHQLRHALRILAQSAD
jgi:two-component system CheB/CheR fusion protein